MKKKLFATIMILSLLSGCGRSHYAGTDDSPVVADGTDGSSITEAADGFSAYSGPILPLTTAGDTPGISATRVLELGESDIDSDASPLISISDSYTLTNTGSTDAQVTLMYPMVTDFMNSLACLDPSATLDGHYLETGLIFGDGLSAWSADQLNIQRFTSFDEYASALAEDSYLATALSDLPELGDNVTVFAFTDCSAPDGINAPTLGISYDLKGVETPVLTYGFNGFEGDYYGSCTRDFFIRDDTPIHLLIFFGDAPEEYELTFGDGGSSADPGGFDYKLDIYQTSFSALLETIVSDYCVSHMARYYGTGLVSPEALYSAAAMMYSRCFDGGIPVIVRYEMFYSLDELLSDVCSIARVAYMTADISIPAGQSVDLTFSYDRSMSYNYYGTGDTEVYGIDLFKSLGSSLDFSWQTITLAGITPESSTFEFGPDGQASITDEHYKLILRRQ